MNSIPKTMRAAAIDRFGRPEVLTIHKLAVPSIDAAYSMEEAAKAYERLAGGQVFGKIVLRIS